MKKQLNYEINNQNEINTKNKIDLNNFRRILRLNLKSDNKKTILKTISKLEKSNDFDYVGPDYISIEASNYPMNPSILDNNQWAHNSIDLPKAWDIYTGSSDVLVGVIDTGINGMHPFIL